MLNSNFIKPDSTLYSADWDSVQLNGKDETKGHNRGAVHDNYDTSNHFQNKTTKLQKEGS